MSNPSFQRRRRYFVDPEVQGALLGQAFKYWLSASVTFALINFVYRIVPAWLSGDATGRFWFFMAPYCIASVIFLPIVVLSAIRFSNRFVGPMVRVRAALKQLTRREIPQRITLRESDFWLDIADDINKVGATLKDFKSCGADEEFDRPPNESVDEAREGAQRPVVSANNCDAEALDPQ